MQVTDILAIIQNPLVILVLAVVIVLIAGGVRQRRKPGGRAKAPLMKHVYRMMTEIDKGKPVSVPPTKSRQEVITQLFESKMKTVGLEPSHDSGYVPVVVTPFAQFLRDHGVAEDMTSAILSGVKEARSESEVQEIVRAAAESPQVGLKGADLTKAEEIATLEWKRMRTAGR
ncbi:MAG: hypothetical protein C4K49_03235 [Candidatus Thorarchaeota archaeon]|nr:MAG: hypothetical protein C4K49_03235 [Candidatus Thorarchaeota archaeon]